MIVGDIETNEGTVNPNRTRLADSVELALRKGEGSLIVLDTDTNEERRFSESFVCPDHPNQSIPDLEPRSFSFNSPHGACQSCHGLGTILQIDEAAIIPNPNLTLAEGAIHPWATSASRMNFMMQLLQAVAQDAQFSIAIPWKDLAPEYKKIVLHGYSKKVHVDLQTGHYGGE